ncbi:DMT family transporter [Mobilicoccus massiliensis]|uniref:DMT family transporter n=1 Tax=Mobilicoccus massiliensis TaxID=1522310 RepID=UPI00058D321C|nr:EamA family transporter [Mobilicoccus massiliensis]
MGAVLVLVAAALWGLLGIFGTYAQRAGLSPYDVAWWRAASGAVLFGVHAFVVSARFPRGRDLAVTALFGLVSGAVFYGAYQVAVAAGGASLASVLLYTAPAFVAMLSVPVLRERLGPVEVVAVVASVVGVGLVALGGGAGVTVSVLSVGAGLLAGFTYSLYYLYGRAFYQRYHPSACLAVALGVAVVALTPLASPAVYSPDALARAWPAVAGVGVLSTYVAYLCHSAGLQRLAATRASVIATIEPVVAGVLASLLLAERPAALAVLGGVVVLAAAVGLALTPRRA